MKIFKFGHACLVVEEAGRTVIIDPGIYSNDLIVPTNVSAIILTHEHPDHAHLELIQKIIETNPSTKIFSHPAVSKRYSDLAITPATVDKAIQIDTFRLEFFGGDHARIAPDWPTFANLGVMVNDTLYYPGDSFTVPNRPINILALPIAAPWLKFSETIDFLQSAKPRHAFPTHDALLSHAGKDLLDHMISKTAKQINCSYSRIQQSPLEA